MVATMTRRIVGWSGIYVGHTHPSLQNRRVSIVAVQKHLPPPEESLRITSNEELAALGGIVPTDLIDVAPAIGDGAFGPVVRGVAVHDLDNAYWIFNPPPRDSHVG